MGLHLYKLHARAGDGNGTVSCPDSHPTRPIRGGPNACGEVAPSDLGLLPKPNENFKSGSKNPHKILGIAPETQLPVWVHPLKQKPWALYGSPGTHF